MFNFQQKSTVSRILKSQGEGRRIALVNSNVFTYQKKKKKEEKITTIFSLSVVPPLLHRKYCKIQTKKNTSKKHGTLCIAHAMPWNPCTQIRVQDQLFFESGSPVAGWIRFMYIACKSTAGTDMDDLNYLK